MPPVFYDAASRIDHVISALVRENVSKLNLTDYVKLDIKLPTDENEETKFIINQHTVSIPLSFHLKHGSIDQSFVDYSLTSMCSLYRDTLNTFVGNDVKISSNVRRAHSHNDDMLLLAECTESARLAVFVEYVNGSTDFSHVKVYVGGNYILMGGDSKPVIYFDNKRYDLTESSFEHPSLEGDFR
jgi:hypothetical protein